MKDSVKQPRSSATKSLRDIPLSMSRSDFVAEERGCSTPTFTWANRSTLTFTSAMLGALAAWRFWPRDPALDTGDCSLRYRVHGDGEPLILLHGFGLRIENWYGLIETLARRFMVIACDARGHGKSGLGRTESLGMAMVDDVARLLDALKIERAHALGYSMGAYTLGKLLETRPDRLRSAILGGGAPLRGKSAIVRDAKREADAIRRGVRTVSGDPATQARVWASFPEWVVAPDTLVGNMVPTRLIVGENDPARAEIDAWRGRIGSSETVVIPNAGHIDALWRPEFLTAASALWDEVDRR